jgi:hypothetical protein
VFYLVHLVGQAIIQELALVEATYILYFMLLVFNILLVYNLIYYVDLLLVSADDKMTYYECWTFKPRTI